MTDKVFSPGEVLTAADVNNYLLNKTGSGNAIINGAFDIWQRGATFSNPASGSYTADRFRVDYNGTGATRTVTRETFTPGTAPVAGYEGAFFHRYDQSVAGTGGTFNLIAQYLEDVRSFAGQTVTLSFFAKVGATLPATPTIGFGQIFGSGGSTSVFVATQAFTPTTSWQRFTLTYAIPSIAGKTIGTTATSLQMYINIPNNATFTIDIWGVQLEAGSVATPFRRNANSLQGELAACQRYYYRRNADQAFSFLSNPAPATSSSLVRVLLPLPVTMRIAPYSVDFSANLRADDGYTANATVSSIAINNTSTSTNSATLDTTTAASLSTGRFYFLQSDNSTSSFVGVSAEV